MLRKWLVHNDYLNNIRCDLRQKLRSAYPQNVNYDVFALPNIEISHAPIKMAWCGGVRTCEYTNKDMTRTKHDRKIITVVHFRLYAK